MVPPGPGDGQLKMENSATVGMRFRPKATMMRIHDGLTDGQAQAETVRFRGVERLEETIHIRRQSDAFIVNGDLHLVPMQCRLDKKPTHVGLLIGHRVSPVEDEVQHQLLQLYSIACDRRQVRLQFAHDFEHCAR